MIEERRRRHAARMWSQRAHAELEAAARFARFAQLLAEFGALAQVIELATTAADDERRHQVRCDELVAYFGGPPSGANELPAKPLRTDLAAPRQQLLYEIVSMSCVTESLSTALLLQIQDRAEDPQVRAVVHEIVRDEVQHARLGWIHLAHEAKQSSVAWLGPRLPAILRGTLDTNELFADGPGAGDQLDGLGGLPRAIRRQVFVECMTEVVFPGLRHSGVDTRAAQAWMDQPAPQ
ncbi:hypothetical protein DB30_05537 [Enhygromyxa salina]|uniref:Ferritin-like domain-containing protein n=1 Tax=Enhygromyxa salina TaxID=215803 RepID=A0A0C1ZCT0_9BACT|nr:ferritin-like domain-containing protein [Enhygromyxa salina]KIG15514.1 hypothetical protein DB30_05537 [Enhygromyxa salina]